MNVLQGKYSKDLVDLKKKKPFLLEKCWTMKHNIDSQIS